MFSTKEAQRSWGRPEDSISPPTQMWLKFEPVTSLAFIPPYVYASETCNIPSRCPVNNSCDARLIFTVLGGSRRVLSSKGFQTPRPRGWHLRPRIDTAVATKTAASKKSRHQQSSGKMGDRRYFLESKSERLTGRSPVAGCDAVDHLLRKIE